MSEQLRSEGLLGFDIKGDYLPDGVVATHAPSEMVARLSTDNGASWVERPTCNLDEFYHLGPAFPGSAILPDDTILVPFFAMRKTGKPPERFTLKGAEVTYSGRWTAGRALK